MRWEFSRCENSARTAAGRWKVQAFGKDGASLRRSARRWFSQRENRHLPADPNSGSVPQAPGLPSLMA